MDFIRQHAFRWSHAVFNEEAFEKAMMKLAQQIATEIAKGTIRPCDACAGGGTFRDTNRHGIRFEEPCHRCFGYGFVETTEGV